MSHYSFKPRRAPTLATALLFPLFLSLGFWQLRRAAEKESLIGLRAERTLAAPLRLVPSEHRAADAIRYRRAVVEGKYDADHQILLDNQIIDHRVGYFVLTPLIIEGGEQAILVNRGWVPAGPDRSTLPRVAVAGGRVRASGVADRFPSVGWRLRGADEPTPGWPAVVQVLDAETLARHLGYPIVPYQVLLDPAEPEGYVRHWTFGSPDPDKSRGYALQWFSFAAILIGLFVWFGFKPRPATPR